MKKVQFVCYLDPRQIVALKEINKKTYVSVACLVRQAIDAFLAKEVKK